MNPILCLRRPLMLALQCLQWIFHFLKAVMQGRYIVYGKIIDNQGRRLPRVTVRVFDRDLPSLEHRGSELPHLGKAVTNERGCFMIAYAPDRFVEGDSNRRESHRTRGTRADLSFQVLDERGQALAITKILARNQEFDPDQILFNVPEALKVSIKVEQSTTEGLSEYEKLIAELALIINDMPLAELTDDDIVFILGEMGNRQSLSMAGSFDSRQIIEWLRRSAIFGRQTNLPTEAFYGWGRMNIPMSISELVTIPFAELKSVVDKLVATSDSQLREGLVAAISENIIPARFGDQIDDIIKSLKKQGQVMHRAVGQILDKESRDPLANLTVRLYDLDAGDEPEDLETKITNAQGFFEIIYPLPEDSGPNAERRLRLKVLTEKANKIKEIFEEEIRLTANQQQVIEFLVTIPVASEPTHVLTELASTLQLELPSGLLSFLSDQRILTLRDIRKSGGIRRLKGLPSPDHPAIRLLEAHADLTGISADIRLNASLIDKGYNSVLAVASAPRTDFVSAIHGQAGDFNSAKLQVVARAQTHFLDNVLTGLMANQANGVKSDQPSLAEIDVIPQHCNCRDCEAAVSPLAYLADLLKYTIQHVKNNDVLITLDKLRETFHQPFGALPAICEAADAQVRQVRLCVEVLRSFLGSRPLADSSREADLVKAEKAYWFDTYSSLLTKIGTSYAELRLAQTADVSDRQALADRLGIDLSHLNALYLDPNPALDPDTHSEALTEQRLEQIFGLVDTARNPLAPGNTAKLQAWRLEYLRALWRNQDFTEDLYEEGESFVTIKQIPSGLTFPSDLADKIRHDAVRQRLVFKGVMTDTERSPLLEVSTDDPYQQAIKQLYHNSQRLPIIDPDLIGPDNLRNPSAGNNAFDIRETRRKWVDNRLSELSTLITSVDVHGKDQQVPDFARMLSSMYQPVIYEATSIVAWASTTPVSDFDALHTRLLQGIDVEAAKFRIKDDLNLTIESFNRLMVIYDKNKAWQSDHENEKVTDAEWQEIRSILVQAQKIKLFTAWRDDERISDIELSPKHFWISLKSPRDDELPLWRSSFESRQLWQDALRSRSQPSVIDPDIIDQGDLKDPVAGNVAFDLMQEREGAIANKLSWLQTQSKTLSGLEASFQEIIGLQVTGFLDIARTQDQGHSISDRLAQLTLDFPAFNYLVRICKLAKEEQTILDTEWGDVHAILIQIWKRSQSAEWRAREKDRDVTLRPDLFQIPPTIPQTPMPAPPVVNLWRAPRLARQEWQDKLQTRIDQEDAIVNALKESVSAVEESHLTGLRDALILASNAPVTATNAEMKLEQKAKWITDNLLIDARMSGCAITTRVAQAIATVQGLLHALRTAQLGDVFRAFVLDLTHFDEEWKWIGSYPSWRAAMFVFLYPENILQPSLRHRKTPGFEVFLKSIRSNRLTPEDACNAAKQYSKYFQDVCSLSVEATCVSQTRLYRGDGCSKTASDERCLFYMFGRSNVTDKVYWSAYDIQDSTGYAQTFWRPIEENLGLDNNIVEILGAVPYQVNSGERFIFLFAKKVDGETESLICAKYNLEIPSWVPIPLATPEGVTRFTAVVKQSDSEHEPPHVLFYVNINNEILFKEIKLNTSGTGWENEGFKALSLYFVKGGRLRSEKTKPVGMIRYGRDAFVVFVQGGNNYYCFPEFGAEQRRYHATWIRLKGGLPGVYVGAFSWPKLDGVFLLSARSISLGGYVMGTEYNLKYLEWLTAPNLVWNPIDLVSPIPNPNSGSLGGGRLATTSGVTDEAGGKNKRLVHQQQNLFMASVFGSNPADHYKLILFRDPENLQRPIRILCDERQLANPASFGPFDIPAALSEADMVSRRDLEFAAFSDNLSARASLLTYFVEAYYFIPIALALALQRSGEYVAALDWFRTVYNYTAAMNNRKIYPGLITEQSFPETYKRSDNWLLDPLDPHLIAATRANTYSRFTILAIVRCLLDYADTEFTRDTAESNPIARRLYLSALELLQTPELDQHLTNECEDIIGNLEDLEIRHERWRGALAGLKQALRSIPDPFALRQAVPAIRNVLQTGEPIDRCFAQVRDIVVKYKAQSRQIPTLADVIQMDGRARWDAHQFVIANQGVEKALDFVGSFAAQDFQRTVSLVTGISPAQLIKKTTDLEWLSKPMVLDVPHEVSTISVAHTVRPDGVEIDVLAPSYLGNLAKMAQSYPLVALNIASPIHNRYVPSPILGFCIPRNPILGALKMRAELNLLKLRTCRNIAGLKRTLEPYAAATDTTTGLPQLGAGGQLVLPGVRVIRPTLYRYVTLIERAKQLVQLAGQIEGAMLSALQRSDDEALNLLKARQELDMAQAEVRLQDLRITESKSKVTLAELGETRAKLQADHYDKLIQDGLTQLENDAITYLEEAADFLDTAYDIQEANAGVNFLMAAGGIIGGAATGNPMLALSGVSSLTSGLSAESGAFSIKGQRQSAYASVASMRASFERRQQEWEYELALSNKDMNIAAQQTVIANDEVRVVEQERVIADRRNSHARDTVEFLTTKKITNVALYDWMSDVLEGVYRFFLQQATAMAKLAENQLAFERQEVPPVFIQSDYWNVVTDDGGAATNEQSPNRRGLTGSARLLQDIYQLDQHAFDTNKRKLQVTKTISLAMLAPVEFQRFRETGILTFGTPMEMFDRDFPGHYLRLIKQVRASVVALIPPSQGINAVLTTAGLSRVVIGPDLFQTVPIRRDPELIALSSPMNSTGLLELEPQTDMLRPFEGTGVDTIWELRMPRAANRFDYRTLMDVLITIDYTALNSFDYYQQVIQTLNPSISFDRSFSFRRHFGDQWYDLHNPDQAPSRNMTVRFSTFREDFPSNVDALKIQQVLLCFVCANGRSFEISDTDLRYTVKAGSGTVGGRANSIDGIISTRRGNAGSWTAMIGKSPVGEWELTLPNTEVMRNRFKNEEIEDILLVITYSGRTPEWPN
ncbi:neuraminidase-like domain-containing protein [Nitrosomonas sp.]|uniref:Tc toxin subunit A-related protein n=1 Tax=Nitrosomonas sp. TaxID=42353 RepID=UPI0025E844A8|nr:neuraminidase-like domain-containing protein [Nitrosomonas sp.]MBV6447992.1 hypothetical protein [Nitrosomonas sp.]